VLLTLLALAAPLPAFAIEEGALPVSATPGPAAIHVSTSVDSCGLLDDGVVCKIDVSFNPVAQADSYSATITRADGSVIDYGSVGPGGASLWVPYVGAGNYSVRITAYGEPDSPKDRDGRGEVIATGSTRSDRNDRKEPRKPDEARHANVESQAIAQASATATNPGGIGHADPDGVATSEAATSAAAAECAPDDPATPPPTPPEPPPEDLDPENPDEDADEIPDEQERITYEQQLAEYEAALAAQQAPPAGC
jgi:hypothetical protein